MPRALLVAVALVSVLLPAPQADACTGWITAASYEAPTDRYPHGVLGDSFEWGKLRVTCGRATFRAELPEELVFEDTAPRLSDLDGDGAPEVIVVESHRDRGARLAVWAATPDGIGRIATTPFIGTRFRWLAPVGAADLDGDGAMEIAYVDRPHLARVLRVWRFRDGRLEEVASAPGVSNHRIGDRDIAGGIRTCTGRPELVVASANWSRVVAFRLTEGRLVMQDLGPNTGTASFSKALDCR